MAARLLKNRVTFLKFFTERHRGLLQMKRIRPCSAWTCPKRTATCLQRAQNVSQHQYSKFSTFQKCTWNQGEGNGVPQSSADNVHQKIVNCSSTEHILDTVQSKGKVCPQHLDIIFYSLVKTRHSELCKEFPWLASSITMARMQLTVCYDIKSRMSVLSNHPGTTLLLNTLEENIDDITIEQACSVTESLCLLCIDTPNYNKLYERLGNATGSLYLKDLRLMAYLARVHTYTHDESRDDPNAVPNKILFRTQELAGSGVVKELDDATNFIKILTSLYGKVLHEDWLSLAKDHMNDVLRVSIVTLCYSQPKLIISFP